MDEVLVCVRDCSFLMLFTVYQEYGSSFGRVVYASCVVGTCKSCIIFFFLITELLHVTKFRVIAELATGGM